MTEFEHFCVEDVECAGRPPTFYCAKDKGVFKKEHLGKVEAVLLSRGRRSPLRHVIQFNEADAYGDTG